MAWPTLLAIVLLFLLPLLSTVVLALFQYDALSSSRFVGLTHFQALADDELFRQSLESSLWIGGLAVPLRLLMSLSLGLLLSPAALSGRIGLAVVLLPVLLPEIAWALTWAWLLNPHFGPVASVLNMGSPLGAHWLLSAEGARVSVAMVTSFLIGEMVLILAIARQRLDPRLFAVCAVEGGSPWYAFRRISLPLLMPLLILLAARDVAVSLQLSFVPSVYVTKTGPMFATYVLPNAIYQSAFEYLRFGYAAAMSCVLIALIGFMAFIQASTLRANKQDAA